ncbi:hypothetical protein [Hydrocarboniclastica marina]|uniref:Uncharacterized protein n=1 Tax=Hydrocarboniclastica marina TaxID=2259620 RepID=A0A4P7XLC0_9ALTE|nr:hypothetical protein [Hydrocarboniclastica marina]QCF28056.1 hypothetical protein soil367_18455 [Hydrocarboniclastica marina]
MQLSISKTRLVLPLSEPETQDVITSNDIRDWAEGTETAKLATAFLILSIPSMPPGANLPVRAERGLAELIESTRTASGRRRLNEAFLEKWSADDFSEGLRLLPYCGINLIKATGSGSKEYLCSGSWHYHHARLNKRNFSLDSVLPATFSTTVYLGF